MKIILPVLPMLLLTVLPVSAQSPLPPKPQPTVLVHLADQTHRWWEPLPVTRRTADRRYDALTALSVLAAAGDIENSIVALRQPNVREADPLYGSHPGRARYYAIAMPVAGLCAYYSYRYKREDDALAAAGIPGHKYVKWWLPEALNIGAHIFGIVATASFTGK